jgi:hypothetical protein
LVGVALRPRFFSRNRKQRFGLSLERLRASVERMPVFSRSMASAATKALCVLNRGISRAKMPRVRALLREPGLGLKFARPVQSAFISRTLSLDQIFGGLPLKEASGFKADSASVRMSSDVLDHGTPCGGCNQSVCDFETRVGEIVGGSPHNLADVFRPSIQLIGRLLQGPLALLSWNRKQHLALPFDALAGLLRRGGSSLLLGNAPAKRVNDIEDVLGPRHGALPRDHDARLLLLEHFNDGFLVMVDEP